MNTCNICKKSTNLKSFINFGKFPFANFPVNLTKFKNYIAKKKLTTKLSGNLDLQSCSSCNYLQLKKNPNNNTLNDIYEKFYTYPSPLKYDFKPTRDGFFLKKLFMFLKKFKYKNILEIGCYDGYILKQLQKKGYEVTGCEPSKGALIGKKFNINIINDFFNKDIFPNKKFDLIIMRHTLEHIPNLEKIMKDMIYIMHDKSTLSIEVPNMEFYVKQGLLEVFSLQHIHYFSIKTFEKLARIHNLKILKTIKSPENIIIFFKKTRSKKIKFNNNIENKKNETHFNKFQFKIKKNQFKIKRIIEKFKTNEVIYWGAGGFAVAAIHLYKLPIKYDSLLIDKDTSKHGLYFYKENIKIKPIISKTIKQKKLIIITSYYSEQIINDIKKMKIKINILQIFPKIKLVKFI
jgi:SAM-dependent methyltransferase